MIRREVHFEGRVQGVGFRATTQAIARGYVVQGWVANDPDGAVTLVAEGEPLEVARFIEAVQQRLARHITRTGDFEGQVQGERGFTVRA